MPPRAFDVDFVNPFLAAVVEVLEVMTEIKATPGKPYLKKQRLAAGEISGVIGITSATTKGSLSVTFSEKCATAVVSGMLKEEVHDIETLRDGVGELTSIISGHARKGLAHRNVRFHSSLPSVISGKKHMVKHLAVGPVLAIPFETAYGVVTVEVCFTSKRR